MVPARYPTLEQEPSWCHTSQPWTGGRGYAKQMGFYHRHPSSCTFGSAQFPQPNGHPPFNRIILWTRKAHNKTVQAKKSIYLIYLFCSLTARTTRGSIPSCSWKKRLRLVVWGSIVGSRRQIFKWQWFGWVDWRVFCKPEISKAFSWTEVELHMFYDEM